MTFYMTSAAPRGNPSPARTGPLSSAAFGTHCRGTTSVTRRGKYNFQSIKITNVGSAHFLQHIEHEIITTHYINLLTTCALMCVLSASTRLIRCWCTSRHSTQFLRTSWFLKAPKMEFLCSTSPLALLLRYCAIIGPIQSGQSDHKLDLVIGFGKIVKSDNFWGEVPVWGKAQVVIVDKGTMTNKLNPFNSNLRLGVCKEACSSVQPTKEHHACLACFNIFLQIQHLQNIRTLVKIILDLWVATWWGGRSILINFPAWQVGLEFCPCTLSTLFSHFLQLTYLFSQVLSLQHSGSKDSPQSKFASYWKPILSMDANFWQRWLHMHRITIILEHDMWEISPFFRHDRRVKSGELATAFTHSLPFTHAQHSGRFSAQTPSQQH